MAACGLLQKQSEHWTFAAFAAEPSLSGQHQDMRLVPGPAPADIITITDNSHCSAAVPDQLKSEANVYTNYCNAKNALKLVLKCKVALRIVYSCYLDAISICYNF